jgi:hypothetical protein
VIEDGRGHIKLTVYPEFMQRAEQERLERRLRRLKPGEELEFDSDAYKLLHRSSVEWSCLNIDVLRAPGGADFPTQSK